MALAAQAGTVSPGRPPARRDWVQGFLPQLTAHLVVALVALVAIGGATRVMQAGLACPDWPLCYGVLLPGRQMNLQVFLEWFHRLDAFLVGIALLTLFSLALLQRRVLPRWLPWCAGVALALVAVQGALGALTVTLLLAAPTVTLHLATALLLVALLSGTHQAFELEGPGASPSPPPALPRWWPVLPLLAGLLVGGQCLLGGAMASRWAADLCLQAGEGCRWLLLHRLGAYGAAVPVLLMAVASLALPAGHLRLKAFSLAAAALVAVQIALGVLTLRLQLQMPAVTVAHQLTAALLVAVIGALGGLTLISLFPSSRPVPAHG